jgi:hypothetical protein
MKKLVSKLIFCIFIGFSLFAAEFQVRLLPAYSYIQGVSDASAGGILSLDFAPVTFRANDKILLSLQGSFNNLFEDGIKSEQLLDYNLSLAYSMRITDRFYLMPEGFGGLWTITENTAEGLPQQNGYFYGGRLSANIHIMPEIDISLFAGYKGLSLAQRFFSHTIHAGLGITYNFTKGTRYSANIEITNADLQPLFPVFYAHYSDNPFGTISIQNKEEAAINDVKVYFYNQYMLTRTLIGSFEKIKQGQSVDVDITALLNESILGQLSDSITDGTIYVEYKLLNKTKEFTYNMSFTTLSRNSMTWADDRQAAAFVSPRDASALKFARQVKSIVKGSLRDDIPANIQYAGALFCALKAYGINYVIDPTSAYSDNTGGLSIDFLQFPYQTLSYHGGDCDDLSIMNCSLLEAIGIETAFITVPGHIFIAFDSGVTLFDADQKIPGGNYVEYDNKAWIPFEITLCTDTFDLALRTGYSQWVKAGEEAAIIPLKDAWQAFKAVSVPEAEGSIPAPNKASLIEDFKNLKY